MIRTLKRTARGLFTDLFTIAGIGCILAGLYLWLGLPAPLLAGGAILIYAGVMLARGEETTNEPDETTIAE